MSTSYDCCSHISCAEFKQRQGSRGLFFIRWESSREATAEQVVGQFTEELIGYNYQLKYLGWESVHEMLLKVTSAAGGRQLPPLRYPAQGFVFGDSGHGWRSVSCLQSLSLDVETWIEQVQRGMHIDDESLLRDLLSVALEKRRARQTPCRTATKI